jgi:hypothetical protein
MPAHLALAPPTPVQMAPDAKDLPGSNVIQHLANGLDSWALIAAMVGARGGGIGLVPRCVLQLFGVRGK